MSEHRRGYSLTPRAMATWRVRAYDLDTELVWALAAEGERQRCKVTSWVVSFEHSLADDEAQLETIIDFVLSLRHRALNSMCSQFIELRSLNTQRTRDIHYAARVFEKEFAQLLAAEDVG